MKETPEQKHLRETTETIARSLSSIAASVQNLLNGPLQRKTLLVLLAHSAKLPQSDVDRVLVALAEMDKNWLKK